MKKQKVKVMLNIGVEDAKAVGIPAYREGQEVEVASDKAELMLKKGWAAAPGTPIGLDASKVADIGTTATTATPPETEGEAEESPVSDTNAAEAIEAIGGMRSKAKLQEIIDNDPRTSVKDAARARLASLPQ